VVHLRRTEQLDRDVVDVGDACVDVSRNVGCFFGAAEYVQCVKGRSETECDVSGGI
jgi:hypothetical protein